MHLLQLKALLVTAPGAGFAKPPTGKRGRLGANRWFLVSLLLSGWLGAAACQETAAPAPPVVLPPVVPLPGPGRLVVSCDPGGCWDEFGVRYDRADAGVFVRVDGRSCLMTQGRMRCE